MTWFCFSIPDKVFCFYNNDATYRSGYAKVTIEDISMNLCTHVIYKSITLSSAGMLQIFDSFEDVTNGGFARLQALRQQHPEVKFMIGLGGPITSSKTFSKLVSLPTSRKTAVSTIMNFLTQQYHFDGLDFNWEYPALKGANPEDRPNFVAFMSELSANMRMYGLVLTLTMAPTSDFFMSSYDLPNLVRFVDYMHVRAFDLHAYWDGKTGHQAALYATGREGSRHESELNVEGVVGAWTSVGVPKDKLILGVTADVNTFKLHNQTVNGVGVRSAGRWDSTEYSRTDGVMSYHELCVAKRSPGWTTILDQEQQAYYAHNGPLWVSYDEPASIRMKGSYIISKGWAGLALFNAENDDVHNQCGQGNYPLLRSINEGLNKNVNDGTPVTTTTAKPVTTTTVKPTTTTTSPSVLPQYCPSNGYVRDPKNCSVYYRCIPNGIFLTAWKYACPGGLVFNLATTTCDYPGKVKC